MRGKVILLNLLKICFRITPAYAGKSAEHFPPEIMRHNHPRLCGEKRHQITFWCNYRGSPPPMRGKAALSGYDCTAGGITPAYAGKSADADSHKALGEDHPRLCGEKAKKARQTPEDRGSPPPMRGKGSRITKASVRIGITPAYAGKSAAYEQRCRTLEDHPRLCGEKTSVLVMRAESPRITPAYAGKSSFLPAVGHLPRDHPRLCGEKW